MSTAELVRPDLILTAGGDVSPADALNPCPSCGHTQHQAPEGVNPDGTPRWNFLHCFKCGFRPGTNVAVDQERMKQAFAAFQKWATENEVYNHPTLAPPDDAEKEALKAQLAQVQQRLADAEAASQQG